MSNDFYKEGDYNVLCDICGKKRKRSQCKNTWDGYVACTVEKCWYPKHPNDYPRKVVVDGLPVADARPRPAVADMSFIAIGGIIRWDDTSLMWETPGWRWDDDPSQNDPENPTQFL